MPFYENVFISRQDISAAQVDGLVEQFSKLIEDNGGKVTKKEYWGLRNLAYRIKKNRKGHYTLMNIDAPPAAVQEMERNMRISEDVIRYLTVNVKELEEEPSIMMRSKGGREERGREGRRWGGGFRGGSGGRPPGGGGRGGGYGGPPAGQSGEKTGSEAPEAKAETAKGDRE